MGQPPVFCRKKWCILIFTSNEGLDFWEQSVPEESVCSIILFCLIKKVKAFRKYLAKKYTLHNLYENSFHSKMNIFALASSVQNKRVNFYLQVSNIFNYFWLLGTSISFNKKTSSMHTFRLVIDVWTSQAYTQRTKKRDENG